MSHQKVIRATIKEHHEHRISELAKATGFTTSQVIRALIENSSIELKPVRSSKISFPVNANGDVNIRQDPHVAVVA